MARTTTACPAAACTVTARAWYNPNLETRWNMIPALIGTLTMLQTLLLTAMSVAREREQGTFDQLLVTPFRPAEIMAGKAMPSMLVGIDAGDRDPAGRAALVPDPVRGLVCHPLSPGSAFSCSPPSASACCSRPLSATMQQAMLYSFVLMMPFTLLSGLTDAAQQHAAGLSNT